MLDLQVLPTAALGLPNLPSALAQVSLGEQVARAYAPVGGVVCVPSDTPTPPPAPMPQGMQPPGHLAYTTAAYQTIPMFWMGTAMLLIGVVLVAAIPGVRRPRLLVPAGAALRPARDRELSMVAPAAELTTSKPAESDTTEAEPEAAETSGESPAAESADDETPVAESTATSAVETSAEAQSADGEAEVEAAKDEPVRRPKLPLMPKKNRKN